MGRVLQSGIEDDVREFLVDMDDDVDPRDVYARVQERIGVYRSQGWTVPEDLKRIERQMMTEFMAESQGR